MVERIERALLLLAWFIEQDGDAHLPIYERFEVELAAIKRSRWCQGARSSAS